VRGTGQTSAGLDRQQFGFHSRTSARFCSVGRGSGGWVGEFAGGQFARRSPPPPVVLNMEMGGVVALSWRGGTVHDTLFMVLVLL
jgi:hypothetical protein